MTMTIGSRESQLRRLRSIGERYAIGRLTLDDALAQVREVTTDRDVLAEAIAELRTVAVPRPRTRARSVEPVLVAAGADLRAVGRYLPH